MFNSQIKHYSNKFDTMVDALKYENFAQFAKSNGWKESNIEEMFRTNSDEFRTLVYNFAKPLIPGRVSCVTYSAIVAIVAEHFKVPYKVFAGFCLCHSNPRYQQELDEYNKRKDTGKEHPILATHVYVECCNNFYEYYNGETSNIEHVDCVMIRG